MNDSRKMFGFVAGILTVIFALLIIIVLSESDTEYVSRAAAAKAVALSVSGKEEISADGPDVSYFTDEADDDWYVGYMDYLYARGFLDPEECPATQESASSPVTRGDLSDMAKGLIAFMESSAGSSAEGTGEAAKSGGIGKDSPITDYILEKDDPKAENKVKANDFWKFYDVYINTVPECEVSELVTDVYGTPENIPDAAAWTAYTKDGKFMYEGLSLDACIDRTVRFLVRDQEIIKVDEIISDEIVYDNAWISGFYDNTVVVFIGNIQREFPVNGVLSNEDEISGQIGDLYLKNGSPTKLVLKTTRITGTVYSVRDDAIEIEGYGLVPLADNFKIYRTYGVLKEQQKKDILVGYHMQEFVVEDNKICAALTTQRPEIDTIRVLISTDDFESLFHSKIVMSCDTDAVLEYGQEMDKTTVEIPAGESVSVSYSDPRLDNGRMVFRPADDDGMITVENITRDLGTPSYPGHLEITREDEGLLLVNEVDLEEYLKRVVPSEMPENYGTEALKAQAICARTYAWNKIEESSYSKYGAHVDDSAGYQVYNNLPTYASTDRAVDETFGQILTYDGEPLEAYYYSTSCGYGSDVSVWGSDPDNYPYLQAASINPSRKKLDLTSNESFGSFIKSSDPSDYDSDFVMYRWNFTTTSTILSEKIGGVGRITGLTVTERGSGGVAKALKVVGTEGDKTFTGASNIRNLLANSRLSVNLNGGGTTSGWDSLPSSFIYIENEGTDSNGVTTFTIYGGGYGHGVGMSQNGAQGMAKDGKSCIEILRFFFDGCELMDIEDVS